jgi:hypothetical protein
MLSIAIYFIGKLYAFGCHANGRTTNEYNYYTNALCVYMNRSGGIIICGSKKKNQTQIIGNDMNYGS